MSDDSKRQPPFHYDLDDVEERNALHNSFEIPSEHARKRLKVGHSAQLIFLRKDTRPERMWVRITALTPLPDGTTSQYTGVLDNDPLSPVMPPRGSTVVFSSHHIMDFVAR